MHPRTIASCASWLFAPSLLACRGAADARGTAAPREAAPNPASIAPAAPSASDSTARAPEPPTASAAAPPAGGPRVFDVRAASAQYEFRITMAKDCPGSSEIKEACAGPATLLVLAKGAGAVLQTLRLRDVWVQFGPDDAPMTNSSGLYDFQGTINVGDFNFDGHEDFAIQVDQHGPYGGPTFAVFLASAGEPPFVRSEALTRLTQETASSRST